MSLWTSLEPSSATVDPGSSTRVRLRLRNTSDVVDEYRFEPVGPVAPWTAVEPQTLRLYPGTTGTVELTFSPPRTPDATAGPNPYAVRITPTEHPEATTAPEGNLTITPFTEMRAELVPVTVKGRFRGRPRLAVDNLGNTKLTASVGGNDNGDHLDYDLFPASVQIEPGRAAFVRTTLKPRRIIWFGPKQQRPYTLTVQRSGAEALPVQGLYVQRGFLPRWLATLFGTLMALAVAFAMVWLAYKPPVGSKAGEKMADAGSVITPAPTPSLSQPPPPQPTQTRPTQTQPQQQQPTAGGSGSGGGGGGSQPARPRPKPIVPAYGVALFDAATKKCASIPGQDEGKLNGPVQDYQCGDTGPDDNQLWNLVVKYRKLGPGGTDLFEIQNAKDQLCMDLPGHSSAPVTTPITEFTCDSTGPDDNQLWWLDKQASGDYWIREIASDNKCLDVSGHPSSGTDNADGVKLTLYDCSNTDDQEWEIIKPGQ